jgi:hypothetical protein
MIFLYRLFSIFINTVALLLAITMLFTLPVFLSSSLAMLSAFMMISIILYAFYSNKFSRIVLQQQQPVKARLKDWIRVNGIVAIVFSLITIINSFYFIPNPQIYVQEARKLGMEVPVEKVTGFLWVMLVYGVVLLTHIVWTFLLMRKYKEYFVEEEA